MSVDFLSSRTSIHELRSTVEPGSPGKVFRTRPAHTTSISWREFLADQPILGKSERFPSFFKINDGELVLSDTKVDGYCHIEELSVWVPLQHEVMIKTIRAELLDASIPVHGTGLGYSKGCTGPLCRRYHREVTNDQAKLRSERLRVLRERRLANEGLVPTVRQPRIDLTEYQRLKSGAPAYAAVDALLVLFCMAQYAKSAPVKPGARVKTWQEICSDRAKIAQFMNEKYGNDVFFQ